MIQKGIGTFYYTKNHGERMNEESESGLCLMIMCRNGAENEKESLCAKGYSYGFCRVKQVGLVPQVRTEKQWYGVNKGDQDCFTASSKSNQRKANHP